MVASMNLNTLILKQVKLLIVCHYEMIGEGTIPNQYGTWGYGRDGWCPGLDVDLNVSDITE